MNWNKITAYAILTLAWLWSTTLQAQVNQQPDTLRFDPVTGLPIKAAPIAPAQPRFDPETGLPAKAEPEVPAQPQFDPETGKLTPPPTPVKGRLAAGEIGLEPTLENVIATAEAEAVRSHNKGQNSCIGAAGCLFSWIGLPITTLYVESGASSGFDKNSASSDAAYYRGLSPERQFVYEQVYQNKVKSLRRRSVYGTQLLILGAFFVMIFLS